MALQTKTFSQSNNGYTLDLVLTEESTSITDNASVLFYRLQLRSGSSNRFSDYRVKAHVTLNSAVVASREMDWSNQISLGYNSSITILSGTTTVQHNADGKMDMYVAFGIEMPVDSYSPGVIAVFDKWMSLTTIARESTITGTAANIGGASVIVINWKNEAYTHSIGIKFGGISGYLNDDGIIVPSEVRLTKKTISFVVPESFYGQIPAAPSGECTLTCKTYSGSIQIGSAQTGKFTITADRMLCMPVVTGTVVDINEKTIALTGDPGKLIKHCSTALCTISATPRNEASIKERKIAGVTVEGSELIIEGVEISKISFWAKDSRDYPNDYEVSADLVPYVILTNNASIKRTDPTSGNAQLVVNGNYFKGNFGAADNFLRVKYRVGTGDYVDVEAVIGDTGGYTVDVIIPGLDYTASHQVEVVVEDALSSVTKPLTVQRGIPVFDWGQNDFRFNVPVELAALTINGVSLEEYVKSIIKGG